MYVTNVARSSSSRKKPHAKDGTSITNPARRGGTMKKLTLRDFILKYPTLPSALDGASRHEACPAPELPCAGLPCAGMDCTAGEPEEEAPSGFPQEEATQVRFEPCWPFQLAGEDEEC